MRKNLFGSVFVTAVFCLFALGVFVTVLLGANTYQAQNEITAVGQNERILLSYVRTKVRGADAVQAVFVGAHHGVNALGIRETINGRKFLTLIYHYDGWVRELFFEYGLVFTPGEGIPILAADSLGFEEAPGGMVRVVTEAGSLYIFPRGGKGTQGGGG